MQLLVDPLIATVVGIIALVSSLIYRFPQIHRTYKTRSAVDISLMMLVIQNISYLAYTAYGILVDDWIYILSSLLSLLQNVTIMYMRYYYMKPHNQNTDTTRSIDGVVLENMV